LHQKILFERKLLNNDVDLGLKLLRSLLPSLIWILAGCQNSGFLVLPTQNFGNSLNSVNREQEPNFSYDGRYMVFASDRLSYRAIFLFDVQQRRLINLPGLNTPGVMQDQPDINADGRYIVYVSEARGKPDIYVYDRISRQNQLITGNILGDIRHPTISGDGRFIGFQIDRNGQWDVQIFDRGPGVRSLPPGAPVSTPSP
jgi:Tol biopolymer transport system component